MDHNIPRADKNPEKTNFLCLVAGWMGVENPASFPGFYATAPEESTLRKLGGTILTLYEGLKTGRDLAQDPAQVARFRDLLDQAFAEEQKDYAPRHLDDRKIIDKLGGLYETARQISVDPESRGIQAIR